MLELILSYLIIIAPSVVTIIGAIVTIVLSVNKMRKNNAETKAAIAEANAIVQTAKATLIEIQSSPELQEILSVYKEEHSSLTKTMTLLTEQLKRIHKLHPEWIDEEGGE